MNKFFTSKNFSILLVNLVPLYGVLFLSWNALLIIIFYVVETILIGILHVIKMTSLYIMNHRNPIAIAVERKNTGVKGLGLIPFFIVHYGFFIFVQMMVFTGFSKSNFWQSMLQLLSGPNRYAIAVIFLSNLTFLIYELFWDEESETKLPDDVFFEPYPRIFVQQFMVIIGGWFTLFDSSMLGYLIVLIICKVILDLIIANFSKIRIKKFLDKNNSEN